MSFNLNSNSIKGSYGVSSHGTSGNLRGEPFTISNNSGSTSFTPSFSHSINGGRSTTGFGGTINHTINPTTSVHFGGHSHGSNSTITGGVKFKF